MFKEQIPVGPEEDRKEEEGFLRKLGKTAKKYKEIAGLVIALGLLAAKAEKGMAAENEGEVKIKTDESYKTKQGWDVRHLSGTKGETLLEGVRVEDQGDPNKKGDERVCRGEVVKIKAEDEEAVQSQTLCEFTGVENPVAGKQITEKMQKSGRNIELERIRLRDLQKNLLGQLMVFQAFKSSQNSPDWVLKEIKTKIALGVKEIKDEYGAEAINMDYVADIME